MKYLTLLLLIGLAFSTTINIPSDYTTIQAADFVDTKKMILLK